ncbi:TIGR04283 family arsenosugar biosynthesis glycosyltransferase [Flavobacterium sp. SUN052]|uniref:TIGR04283 family arsenosugar biosynthesis glycosyltransferase n=1 Tax=Flavobacterium sp. SUN052 TaxID=3002441 RepID=UPI00237D407E|nr:TIGR04283 family arsenosugar biosynthesis glycosyltransferase [Flavobacterium sp. SUN052]MEC4004374.1 TIGR04283 family arsenosugar biosynthesis glycosyltransferase [Flavobacterium sp. SUN052]
MILSIIIPTYNEALIIKNTIEYLHNNLLSKDYEIIVSDGGSTDETLNIAKNLGAKVLLSPVKGRAGQMNYGVKNSIGSVFLFLHADSLPTPSFYDAIQNAIQNNFNCGSFRTKFDSKSALLKINSFFTRFNYLFFRGGDQGIFVTQDLWNKIGTFKEEMFIMEDYDYIQRLWQSGNFKLIPKATIISARKYHENSWLTVQLANLKIVRMYKNGASQMDMVNKYKELLSYRKNAF